MKHQTYIIERDLMKRFYSSRKYHEERNHREGKIIKIPKKKNSSPFIALYQLPLFNHLETFPS